MKNIVLGLLAGSFFLFACQGEQKASDKEAPSPCLGQALDSTAKLLMIQEALALYDSGEGRQSQSLEEGLEKDVRPVLVQGKLIEVCKMAGCWFVLEGEGGTKLFFSVKEHGFKVPADALDKTLRVQAYIYTEQISVAEQQEQAREEGLSKEEIDAISEVQETYQAQALGLCINE